MKRFFGLALGAGALVAASGQQASAQVVDSFTFVSSGVDTVTMVQETGAKLGLVIVAAVGVWAGILVVRRALRWVRTALSA